ncbi:MAG TPA: response regulator transcription factor [Opitutaceae bacterium]
MKHLPRILVVDDDRSAVAAVRRILTQEGFRVLEAYNGDVAIQIAINEQPDLVLLDFMMPGRLGPEVCTELRRRLFYRPILMLTGRDKVEDCVAGLSVGADDYLAKSFDSRELIARIHALTRREQRAQDASISIDLGDIHVDFQRRIATRAATGPLRLTKTEFALLELLAGNAGRPVSRKTMLDVVWGYTRTPNTRTVDTHIWRLRRKLNDNGVHPRWIRQIPGQGYVLSRPVEHSEANPPNGAGISHEP